MRDIPDKVVALSFAGTDTDYHPACSPRPHVEGELDGPFQIFAGDAPEGRTYLCAGCGKKIKDMKQSEFW